MTLEKTKIDNSLQRRQNDSHAISSNQFGYGKLAGSTHEGQYVGYGNKVMQSMSYGYGGLQLKKDEQEESVQLKQDSPTGVSNANNTGLPDHLKSGIENLSGMYMGDVKVHYNSDKPAQMKAHAYAQGTDIHVAAGQEKHLPHEAWHVVQQKQGRVKPTIQMKGAVNINDDAGLEKEADVMGQKATQLKQEGKSAGENKTLNISSNISTTISRMPIQLMATSKITDYRQAGGTCGLYSLGMAISSVHPGVVLQRDRLLELLLQTGNNIGSFVGEFMDANNLAEVGRQLGLTVNVIDFGNVRDFKSKLRATGSNGVIMGYSVFDVPMYRANPTLAAFKHLFSHWSVIEAMNGDNLIVRDPNDPGSTRVVPVSTFHQSNQDAENTDGSGKFSFQEFQTRGIGDVNTLRNTWENQELTTRGGNTAPSTPLDLHNLPTPDMNLKGKIVSVSGTVTALNTFSHMKESGTLRAADKSEIRTLNAGEAIEIIDRNRAGNNFDLGLISIKKRHFWVRASDGTEGWVRASAIN